MSIIRVKKDKDNPYVIINKNSITDKKMPLKAKGLFSYLMSLPDDWKLYVKELQTHFPDGRQTINNAIDILIKLGYMKRTATREVGKFSGYDYTIYESPMQENRNGKADAVKPTTVKRPLLSINNNKLSNNKTKYIYTSKAKGFYGDNNNVSFTTEEHNKLLDKHGGDIVAKAIDKLSAYKLSRGKKYKSDYGAMNSWAIAAVKKGKNLTNKDPAFFDSLNIGG